MASALKHGLGMACAVLALAACGGGGGGAAPAQPTTLIPPAPPPATSAPTKAETFEVATALWRNADPAVHPKGSCAGCHGPDFIDLAVIGSTRDDIVRRAEIDGATPDQATALADAVEYLRADHQIPARNARTFRPFQPGGAVMLPDHDGPLHVARVDRDIAFGQQIERLLPTLFGPRVTGLEHAERARGEMLDLVHGTNDHGANPDRLNLRSLPMGMPYPLWSADLHHGEGTFNDWIADIAHDVKAEYEAEWTALVDTYLDDPSRNNFWRLYAAAETMTEAQQLEDCTYDGQGAHLACEATEDFNRNKFQSALMGQHLMREQLAGREGELLGGGALALSYIDEDPELRFMLDRKSPNFLPSNLWEVGDRARVMLDNDNTEGSFRVLLAELGFPVFAQESVAEDAASKVEQHDLRRAWFWLGFTTDPSFARMHPSNSTKVGEYMIASLLDVNMHMHNSFAAHMRIIAKGTLPEANVARFDQRLGQIERVPPAMRLNYNYFIGYNRTELRWKEDRRNDTLLPQGLKDTQAALWHRFNANAFRMGMELYLAEVESGAEATDVVTYPIKVHFDLYQPEHKAEDYALLNRVQAALGEDAYY